MPLWAEEQVSWMNPRNVNCADFTPPPTVGRPSRITQRNPALARYAALTRLLCPAPATTISNRSEGDGFCAAAFSELSANGASAAPFTNPRLVIPLIISSCRVLLEWVARACPRAYSVGLYCQSDSIANAPAASRPSEFQRHSSPYRNVIRLPRNREFPSIPNFAPESSQCACLASSRQ